MNFLKNENLVGASKFIIQDVMENVSIIFKVFFSNKNKIPSIRESFATDLLCELQTSCFTLCFQQNKSNRLWSYLHENQVEQCMWEHFLKSTQVLKAYTANRAPQIIRCSDSHRQTYSDSVQRFTVGNGRETVLTYIVRTLILLQSSVTRSDSQEKQVFLWGLLSPPPL